MRLLLPLLLSVLLLFVGSNFFFSVPISAHILVHSQQQFLAASSGNFYTITPPISKDVRLNPGKGWVLYGKPEDQTTSTMANATVGYNRYNWSALEPTEGTYRWELIDHDLNAWHAAGKRFAFGVMGANSSNPNIAYITPKWVFSDGAVKRPSHTVDDVLGLNGFQQIPVWNDAIFLKKVQDFVTALAKRYDGNPNIAFIDIRSYGNWGAQNVYGLPGSALISSQDVQKHLNIYENAFRKTQLIVPWGTPKYSSVYSQAVKDGIGLRTDALLDGSHAAELGQTYGKVPAIVEFRGGYQWLSKKGYWNTTELQRAVNDGKPSYMSLGLWGNDGQIMLAHEPDLVHRLANTMGYDFVLSSATLPSTIINTRKTSLSFSWKNQGVAYLGLHASVAVALLDASNTVVQKQWLTNVDPRTWEPGKTVTTNEAITFDNVKTGTYKLAVGLYAQTTDSNPTYQIGNQGRTSNNWYVLNNSTAVDASTWTAAGSMSAPRWGATATLLPSGKVLVTGGMVTGGALKSAVLYDPTTGTWTSTGSMSFPRDHHTATLLPNGKVLVVGDDNSPSTLVGTAELYDPATGTWTTTGSPLALRYEPTATLLPTGKVLVVGGVNHTGLLNSAELYDPATGAWTTTGLMSTFRLHHTATLLPNGKVLVVGGAGGGNVKLASAELYDPATGTWSSTGSMSNPHLLHTATLLSNGKVLVVGGIGGPVTASDPLTSTELYDPAKGTWTTVGSMSFPRDSHTATLLPSGKVLVSGGVSTSDNLKSAELYDPATGAWTTTGSMSTPRYSHTATLLPSGKVLVAGGDVGAGTELYDPGS